LGSEEYGNKNKIIYLHNGLYDRVKLKRVSGRI
jgi:hypothetical protein